MTNNMPWEILSGGAHVIAVEAEVGPESQTGEED